MLNVSNLAPAANSDNIPSNNQQPTWNGSTQTLNKFILELEQLLQLDGDAWQLIHEQSISLNNGKTVIESPDIIPILGRAPQQFWMKTRRRFAHPFRERPLRARHLLQESRPNARRRRRRQQNLLLRHLSNRLTNSKPTWKRTSSIPSSSLARTWSYSTRSRRSLPIANSLANYATKQMEVDALCSISCTFAHKNSNLNT